MKKKKKQKYSLSTTKNRLIKARSIASDKTTQKQRREFIDKFTLCDVTCTAVLEAYKKTNGTYTPGKHFGLDMRSIPSAMDCLGVDVPKHVLGEIFSSTGKYKKRGTKSAKMLRNGIVHSMNKDDITEVVERYEMLIELMDFFLSYF